MIARIVQRVRRFKRQTDDTSTQHAQEDNERPRGSGQGAPGQEADRNDDSSSESLKANSRHGRRRTGLRTIDRHASWREVAYACHCDPEGYQ